MEMDNRIFVRIFFFPRKFQLSFLVVCPLIKTEKEIEIVEKELNWKIYLFNLGAATHTWHLCVLRRFGAPYSNYLVS